MRLQWQSTAMTRRTCRTPHPSQQVSASIVTSSQVKVAEDILSGPTCLPILSQAAALPLAHNVASVAIPTFDSACAPQQTL